jgi:hypothetical protein
VPREAPTAGKINGHAGSSAAPKDALQQSVGPTAVQLVRNFQATLTAELESRPVLLPLHLCSPYGSATAEAVDILRISPRPAPVAYGAMSCEIASAQCACAAAPSSVVTVADFLRMAGQRHLLDGGSPHITAVHDHCRLWGLYCCSATPIVSFAITEAAKTAPRLQHSPQREWRLLTVTSADYQAALASIVAPDVSRPASALRNGKARKRSIRPEHRLLGLMVEYTTSCWKGDTGDVHEWPTERVLAGQGQADSAALHACGACPFKIAEQVDMLTEDNRWMAAVVTNIVRETAVVTGASDALSVQYAVRPLKDGEVRHAPAPLAPVVRRAPGEVVTTADETVTEGQRDTARSASSAVHVETSIPVPQQSLVSSRKGSASEPSAGASGPAASGGTSEVGAGGDGVEGSEVEDADGGAEGENSDVESAVEKNKGDPEGEGAGQDSVLDNSQEDGESDSEESSGSEEETEDEDSRARPTKTVPAAATSGAGKAPAAPLREEDVPFAPNGVTYDKSRLPGATADTIVVPYNSVRILRLGTMTSLPVSLALFGNTGAACGPLAAGLMEYARKFEAHTRLAQSSAVDMPTTQSAPIRAPSPAVNSTTGPSPTPPSQISQPSQASISRQSSSVTPAEDTASQSETPLYRRQPNTPSNYRGSFLGKGSVTPLDVSEVASPADSCNTSHADLLNRNPGGQATVRGSENSTVWNEQDTQRLRQSALDVTHCPAPLRALQLLLHLEDSLLHRAIVQPLTPAELKRKLATAPGAVETGESHSTLHSGNPMRVGTIHISAAYRGDRVNRKRNPVAKFCRSISKGFQRALMPEEYNEYQRQLAAQLQASMNDDETESDSGDKARNNSALKHQTYEPVHRSRGLGLGAALTGRSGRHASSKLTGIRMLGVAGELRVLPLFFLTLANLLFHAFAWT